MLVYSSRDHIIIQNLAASKTSYISKMISHARSSDGWLCKWYYVNCITASTHATLPGLFPLPPLVSYLPIPQEKRVLIPSVSAFYIMLWNHYLTADGLRLSTRFLKFSSNYLELQVVWNFLRFLSLYNSCPTASN